VYVLDQPARWGGVGGDVSTQYDQTP